MEKAAVRQGRRFLDRIFTPGERAYCESKRMKYEHYAARLAAKEAVLKAIGIREKNHGRLREIELRRKATGKPFLILSAAARKHFKLPSKFQIEVSVAHEREHAIASVLLILP